MSLSKIVVSGRVIRSPEKRFTPSTNIAVTEFAIAVESPPGRDGQVETTQVKVVTWRDLAERCAQDIKKGDLVAVDGRLQINVFNSQDGQKKREAEIDAINVENLSQSGSQASARQEDRGEEHLAKAGAKAAKPAPASDPDDLDAIFASDDEIPF